MAGLVRALLAAGRHQEAAGQASQALTMVTDPVRRAETYWVLARAQVIAGDNDDAVATVRRALASAGLPRTWRARMLASLAMLERVTTGDIDVADATARQALAVARRPASG
jgi:tetratricopeptide (TPR) repeat protein